MNVLFNVRRTVWIKILAQTLSHMQNMDINLNLHYVKVLSAGGGGITFVQSSCYLVSVIITSCSYAC